MTATEEENAIREISEGDREGLWELRESIEKLLSMNATSEADIIEQKIVALFGSDWRDKASNPAQTTGENQAMPNAATSGSKTAEPKTQTRGESGFAGRLHDSAKNAIEMFRRGEKDAAEALWSSSRKSAQERGMGIESDHTKEDPNVRDIRTPWGPVSFSWAITRGVTSVIAQRMKGYRVANAAAKAMLSVDAREAGVKGSGYLWFDDSKCGLLWSERPEWGMLRGASVEWVAGTLDYWIARTEQ